MTVRTYRLIAFTAAVALAALGGAVSSPTLRAQATTIIGHFDYVEGRSGQVRLQGSPSGLPAAQVDNTGFYALGGMTTNGYGGALGTGATGTGTLTSGSATVTGLATVVCDNNPALGPQHLGSLLGVPSFIGVFGPGVPSGTIIQSCTSPTVLVMSASATISASNQPLSFAQVAYSDFEQRNTGTWWGNGFFAVGSPYWMRNGGAGTCGGDHSEHWCIPFSVTETGSGHYKAARFANESTISDGVTLTSGILVSMEEAQGSNDTAGVEIVGGNSANHNYLIYGSDNTGTYKFSVNANRGGEIGQAGLTYSLLDGPSNGALVYCSDCANTSGPGTACAASGTGSFAFRVNGGWKCL